MRELTFFTTSTTKLAHARYIAERFQIRIQGFRQRTYHAGYKEPRLHSREAILEQSYRSAVQQLRKAGYSDASHPFILEDTSVRINALSIDGEEVPGVDIKFWMEGRTFDDLDRMLKAAGGNRVATVRSDVLLHVPSSLRRTWSTDANYLTFTGTQTGTIIDKPVEFETNPVYPWLDNQSFNKWFCPDRQKKPFGALGIEIADTYDFRRKAFESLFDFLKQRRFILPAPAQQLSLQLEEKPNFILCGYPCAGKTVASQHLARSSGYLHVEASDFMHLSYYYRHGYRGPVQIGDFAESALIQKPVIAAERVAEYILQNLDEPIIVSGFRAPEEVSFVQKELAVFGKVFSLLFINADERIRFERSKTRARPGDAENIQEFRERDMQQTRMGLNRIETSSDAQKIANEDTLAEFLVRLDRRITQDVVHDINIAEGIAQISLRREVILQDAILIALLSVWRHAEDREFYTTTQIAALIRSVFPEMHPKHKDNVSRYFNQDFYAYFEITGTDAKRRYRLSNTGYGMALRALRAALKEQPLIERGTESE